MLEILNFLKAGSMLTLLGESVADLLEILCFLCSGGVWLNLGSLSGELRYLGYVLQLNLPWYLGEQSN